jgi:hypothetical protein
MEERIEELGKELEDYLEKLSMIQEFHEDFRKTGCFSSSCNVY